MLRILAAVWLSAYLFLSASAAFGQTVYFQRFLGGAGTVSAVSPLGPSSTLMDLAANIPNARAGGVDANGAGLVFYSDRGNDQILAVDASRNVFVILLPFSGVSDPQAISLDLSGNFLYIADVGNGRIVRVDLSVPLPTNRVQVVVDGSAGVTDGVGDLKYNSVDGYLYWTNNGTLHRAAVKGQQMPVQSGETLLTANSIGVSFFDFDLITPQNIFFSSGSGGFEGIYRSPLPTIGDTPQMSEVSVLDTSANPDVTISGIATDKNGPFFCYTANNTPAPIMRCGDRTTANIDTFTDLLSSEFSTAPNFLVIDSPSPVVRPDTRLAAPMLQLNLALPRPEVLILLRQFDSAVLKTVRQLAARGDSGKIGFRYAVEVKRTADADGKSISKSAQDRRTRISMRNSVTARNLAPNSTYQVRYNIQITRKERGQPVQVVRKTPLSPFSSVVVPRK